MISFLNDHDFDWNATFRAGVRYLSRDEATESRLRREDSTRPRFTDSMPASGDQIGEDMIEAARERVKLWVKDGQQKQPYVMIPVRDEDGRRPSLNGYQRSLLYTMLRREFPDLAGYKTDDGIQVRKQTPHGIAYEKKRDEYARGVNNILTSTNKGLGWIFEALVADSDLSGLTDNVLGANGEDIKKRRTIIDEAVLMLKLRGPPPIFVHNGFSDMLYLYQTFFHNLPPTWAEFSTQIHKLFPIIYDTRYLCTAKDPAKSRHESSLDHLYQRLSLTCPLPELLEMHGHWTQHNTGKAHEAGQDAYVTAMCAIKLSTWMAHIAINSGNSIEDSPILKGVDESEKARSKPLEMPPFEHAIWEPYVNRLRVYAAVEEQAEIKCCGDRCNGGRAHHRYPVETGKIYPPPPSPVQELVVVEKRTRGKKARVKVKAKAEVEVDKNNRFATLIDFGD